MPDGSNIDWLDIFTLSISTRERQESRDWLNTIEEVSERNHTGRPVRYLFDLSTNGMTVSKEDGADLASFFLELTPSRTAIALVSNDVENPGPGELAFRNALRRGGFEVCVFNELASAQVWLSLFVSSCDRKGLTCGPDCEFALERTCPANDPS